MRARFLLFLFPPVIVLGTLGFAALVKAQSGKPAKTILDGVYTVAQAERGRVLYDDNCADCHEGAAFDGTPMEGAPLINNWREDSLEPLFDYIQEFMPQDNPKTLADEPVRDILAHILRMNAYPAGKEELTQEGIRTIWFVGPDGPQPLPANVLIQVVGCFAQGPEVDAWLLNDAGTAVRTRDGAVTTPDEKKRAEHRALGQESFRLQNLDYVRPDFKPGTYKGQKVLIKGVMLRGNNNKRINVTGLEPIAPTCP